MELTEQDPEEWIENQKESQFESFREDEVVGEHCQQCQFSPDPIIKRGSLEADLMIVGEFPIRSESDAPFTGDYGALVDDMLDAIDLTPDRDCYLTNALLCGGSQTDVQPSSLEACYQNVSRQIELVSPGVVLGMGRLAYCSLYQRSPDEEFADPWGHQGALPDYPWVEGIVTINPVHLFRAEEGTAKYRKMKKLAWDHLKLVRKQLDTTDDSKSHSDEDADT
jgi:uracil-DNA glycosylase family 4